MLDNNLVILNKIILTLTLINFVDASVILVSLIMNILNYFHFIIFIIFYVFVIFIIFKMSI